MGWGGPCRGLGGIGDRHLAEARAVGADGVVIDHTKAGAAELVRDGVPKDAIGIQGFGETHLLVSTGPGVREAQNRRVEIIIR